MSDCLRCEITGKDEWRTAQGEGSGGGGGGISPLVYKLKLTTAPFLAASTRSTFSHVGFRVLTSAAAAMALSPPGEPLRSSNGTKTKYIRSKYVDDGCFMAILGEKQG